MQAVIDAILMYWSNSADAILLLGIPAVAMNLVAHGLEEPVYRYLMRAVTVGSEAPSMEDMSSYSKWCIAQYKKLTQAYDVLVSTLKSMSYLFALGFGYRILDITGLVGFAALLLPLLYCVLQRPTIQLRVESDLENTGV